MRRRRPAALLAALALASAANAAPSRAPARIVSLDQCADQYVLALAPRDRIAGLSMRAEDYDSHLRSLAAGLPRRRNDLESVLASGAGVAVAYWGAAPGLQQALHRRGVALVTIADASDFGAVAADVRHVARALGEPARGEALIAGMQARLAWSRGAGGGREALYLTGGGATAGPGSLTDAILRAAGLRNWVRRPGFSQAPAEDLILRPPPAVVAGYFDARTASLYRGSIGRSAVLRRVLRGRILTRLPADLLGCPAWYAAEAAAQIARALRS